MSALYFHESIKGEMEHFILKKGVGYLSMHLNDP